MWKEIWTFPVYGLSELIGGHTTIARDAVANGFTPLPHLRAYWRSGYFPYAQDDEDLYNYYVGAGINTLLDVDLPAIHGLTPATTEKIKKLLVVITESVPFKPNMSKLAAYLGVHRETLQTYLFYLHEARLIALLPRQVRGIIRTQKPEKIYLDNPNLLYAIPGTDPNLGTLRETFVLNALTTAHVATGYAKSGDFQTDHYLFEVGGKGKSNQQIAGLDNAYRLVDDYDVGGGNRIPLWVMGLLR